MSRGSYDKTRYVTTSELLARGWPRPWLERFFGSPIKGPGNRKLWPRDETLAAEQHPAFAYGVARLRELARHAPHAGAEIEHQALDDALAAFEAGTFGPVPALDPTKLPEPAADAWPTAELTADALTLVWDCGGTVVVPVPFLNALRQGLGETSERLWLAVNTVLTDWRVADIKPAKMQWGRNYFLASVRNVLVKLRELEAPCTPASTAEGEGPRPPPGRILH
jgi:hypothetical protein